MVRRAGLVWAVTIVALVAGCATPSTQVPSAPNSASVGGTLVPQQPITITRTGGMAGVQQSIVVGADGAWTYSSGKGTGTPVGDHGTLTADQLAQLEQALADPAFATQAGQHSTGGVACADAFQYAISVGTESWSFADCPKVSRPAVDKAIAVLTDATPF